MSSLILIAIGNGSIRACITSLGGQQFQMPEQSKQLDQYFSHYYLIYSAGVLLSKIIPPAIRANTQCFGKDECYLAVFGSLSVIFLTAWRKFCLCCLSNTHWLMLMCVHIFSYLPERYALLQRRRDRRSRRKYIFSGCRLCIPRSKTKNARLHVSHINEKFVDRRFNWTVSRAICSWCFGIFEGNCSINTAHPLPSTITK